MALLLDVAGLDPSARTIALPSYISEEDYPVALFSPPWAGKGEKPCYCLQSSIEIIGIKLFSNLTW